MPLGETKLAVLKSYKALAELQKADEEEKINAISGMPDFSNSVFTVNKQSVWLSLQTDSLIFMPFVQTYFSEQKDGCPLLQKSNDYINLYTRGVNVFSFRMHLHDCNKASIIISYKSGNKEDEIEEEITTPGDYDTPAVITNKDELTTINLRVKSGNVVPTHIHLVSSYSKVEWK